MLQIYRLNNQIDNIDTTTFFSKATYTKTRSNGHKFFKGRYRTSIRGNAFSQRSVDTWNNLPADVVSAKDLNHFKSALRGHWREDEDRYHYA